MKINWGLVLPSSFLFLIGVFNLVGVRGDLITSQFFAGLIGIVFFLFLRKVGVNFFRSNSKLFYWVGVALLLLTYVVGFEARGSKRWIDLYFFSFQASEFFKPFFVLFIAQYVVEQKNYLKNYKNVFKLLGYFLLPTFLVLKQPDLGTALVYCSLFLPIFLSSGIPKRILVRLGVFAGVMIPVFWFFLKEYQRLRLSSFLDPQADVRGSGYNLIQSIIAIGSGKVTGRGLGYGTQANLNFLPEFHTDFAFASLVEQFGFIGGLLVIALFIIIARSCIQIIVRKINMRDDDGSFRFLYILGVFSSIVFQVLINIGMNMGLFPITGITLPFISYGGSSLVAAISFFAFFP